MALTRRIDPVEARVLGALMEKEQTTPDAYPLTVNALLLACNQRSNRQPVTTLGEQEVRDALNSLRKDVLAWRVDGARVERWEHRLTGRWRLDPPAKAILTLLLLRGPQTPGELRSRSGRMHSFEEVAEVESKLRELAEGDDRLVRELAREPGQRENRWQHVMLRDDDGAQPEADLRTAPSDTRDLDVDREMRSDRRPDSGSSPGSRPEPGEPQPGGLEGSELEKKVAELADKLAELELRLERLELG